MRSTTRLLRGSVRQVIEPTERPRSAGRARSRAAAMRYPVDGLAQVAQSRLPAGNSEHFE
jgi:hypothetical protein